MTRTDILNCVHEPFGDAFYFGPERLSTRYENDEKARQESGFEHSTYKTIFDRIEKEHEEVRPILLVQCMTALLPGPVSSPSSLPSFQHKRCGPLCSIAQQALSECSLFCIQKYSIKTYLPKGLFTSSDGLLNPAHIIPLVLLSRRTQRSQHPVPAN